MRSTKSNSKQKELKRNTEKGNQSTPDEEAA